MLMSIVLKLHKENMEFVGFEGLTIEGTFSILSSRLAVCPYTLPIQNNRQDFVVRNGFCDDKFMLYEIKNMFGIKSDAEGEIPFMKMPNGTFLSSLEFTKSL